MIRVGVVGLGKMGLSHLAMFRAHPDVELAAVCDSSSYVLDVLAKYTGLRTFTDFDGMLARAELDAVVVATPSHLHARMVQAALRAGLHVFCEKPFCLDVEEGTLLAGDAQARGLVTQVGYHNRFVASFAEMKRLVDAGAIGQVTHVLAEAYGPVVLAATGTTWRTRRAAGGGCLYDYAAHPVDLVQWLLGVPTAVGGSRLHSVFSAEIDDQVLSTLFYPGGTTAQLSVNWSDESERKMTTKITVWGTGGRLYADRQELRAYLRVGGPLPAGYKEGWNVRYTTDLTDQPWYYLRGEEYSAQVDEFVSRVMERRLDGLNTFASAAATDRILGLIAEDAATNRTPRPPRAPDKVVPPPTTRRSRRLWERVLSGRSA